jgi:hypothetical protein
MDDWTTDIEFVLENIRVNCVVLSKEHKRQYFIFKDILQYFRLPLIIISGINSIISVGLQPYVTQSIISMVTCLLALICSIIGSIELYLAIQKSMENELNSQRDYYLMSVDIYKTLALSREHRPVPAKDYLEKQYNSYCKLIENSNTVMKRLDDRLAPLPNSIKLFMPPSPSSPFLEKMELKNSSPALQRTNTSISGLEDIELEPI